MTQIRRQKPGRDKPTDNQMLAEVIPEQANFSVSVAWPSKVLYAIPASPSHPPQTVPGSRSQTPSKGWEPQALGHGIWCHHFMANKWGNSENSA